MFSRNCAERDHEELWEDEATVAERFCEVAVSLGDCGLLLKDLKLLRCRQNLKTDTMLFAQDGSKLHSFADKLDRWQEHFAQVSSVSVELEESMHG